MSSRDTAWSEWEWNTDYNQWVRWRISGGEYEYDYNEPESSTSKAGEKEKKEKKKEKEKEKEKKKDKGKGKGKGKEKERKGKNKETVEGNLSVALYRPKWGNLRHWALYLDTDNWIYEVTGEPMHFTAEAKDGVIPTKSGSWVESIHVAKIQPVDMAELHRIITETPVQNDVQGWCCQDYVMEALESLNAEQIVDDEDFEKVKKLLMKKFNK